MVLSRGDFHRIDLSAISGVFKKNGGGKGPLKGKTGLKTQNIGIPGDFDLFPSAKVLFLLGEEASPPTGGELRSPCRFLVES